MAQQLIQIKIMTPQQVVFNGPALSLSSKNTDGKFDIIAQHANFITIVEDQPIDIIQPDKRKISFNFNLAIIHNASNIVSVFANILGSQNQKPPPKK